MVPPVSRWSSINHYSRKISTVAPINALMPHDFHVHGSLSVILFNCFYGALQKAHVALAACSGSLSYWKVNFRLTSVLQPLRGFPLGLSSPELLWVPYMAYGKLETLHGFLSAIALFLFLKGLIC
ncbi:hypothetical protein CHARACLAT_015644 [Characodon lateralis]|uniref:Uncharacterized protein n=1 Tax=Characodon lateralis TaxID=208331 RepID=A0ABU7CNQ2_9TELE|nr:hypothetical protein [Characodon lateralis]